MTKLFQIFLKIIGKNINHIIGKILARKQVQHEMLQTELGKDVCVYVCVSFSGWNKWLCKFVCFTVTEKEETGEAYLIAGIDS